MVEVIDDSTPELDEEFRVQLLQPMGGAILGTQSSVSITVLTNDDAHGLIGFAEVRIFLKLHLQSIVMKFFTFFSTRGYFLLWFQRQSQLQR